MTRAAKSVAFFLLFVSAAFAGVRIRRPAAVPVAPDPLDRPASAGRNRRHHHAARRDKLSEALGQQVVVDNRPGGVFTVGSEIVAKAPARRAYDRTLLTPHVVNPFVMKNLPYNTERDFTPVSLLVIVPGVMTMHPSVGPNNLKEVIALAKAKPGQLNYGSPGPLTHPL